MELRREVEVAATVDEAWAVLGEQFGEIATWTNAIMQSSLEGKLGVGAVRTCTIEGFGPFKEGAVKERLIAFDEASRSFEYEAFSGLPGFLKSARNRWTIEPAPSGCVVTTHARIELSGIMKLFAPFIKMKIAADASSFLEEMRYRIERGEPHPRTQTGVAWQPR